MKDEVTNKSGSKYLREVPCRIGELVDVYAVIDAFAVTCPARQHALKKLLCSGIRGKGDVLQDLRECRDAVTRAIQMEESKMEHLAGALIGEDDFVSRYEDALRRQGREVIAFKTETASGSEPAGERIPCRTTPIPAVHQSFSENVNTRREKGRAHFDAAMASLSRASMMASDSLRSITSILETHLEPTPDRSGSLEDFVASLPTTIRTELTMGGHEILYAACGKLDRTAALSLPPNSADYLIRYINNKENQR